MTIQNLIDLCNKRGISLNTQVAIRAKSDYLLTEDRVHIDVAYFGNCDAGMKWDRNNIPLDDDEDVKILILDTE